MISRTFGLLLSVTITGSCAARANLDALDVPSETGRAGWDYSRGTVCDFRSQETICISGVDDGRRLDVSSTIADVVAKKTPGSRTLAMTRDLASEWSTTQTTPAALTVLRRA